MSASRRSSCQQPTGAAEGGDTAQREVPHGQVRDFTAALQGPLSRALPAWPQPTAARPEPLLLPPNSPYHRPPAPAARSGLLAQPAASRPSRRRPPLAVSPSLPSLQYTRRSLPKTTHGNRNLSLVERRVGWEYCYHCPADELARRMQLLHRKEYASKPGNKLMTEVTKHGHNV